MAKKTTAKKIIKTDIEPVKMVKKEVTVTLEAKPPKITLVGGTPKVTPNTTTVDDLK